MTDIGKNRKGKKRKTLIITLDGLLYKQGDIDE